MGVVRTRDNEIHEEAIKDKQDDNVRKHHKTWNYAFYKLVQAYENFHWFP